MFALGIWSICEEQDKITNFSNQEFSYIWNNSKFVSGLNVRCSFC